MLNRVLRPISGKGFTGDHLADYFNIVVILIKIDEEQSVASPCEYEYRIHYFHVPIMYNEKIN